MKRTILGMTQAGEPLILEALEALRLYREAKTSGRPQEEIDRLKILAESLVSRAVSSLAYSSSHSALPYVPS